MSIANLIAGAVSPLHDEAPVSRPAPHPTRAALRLNAERFDNALVGGLRTAPSARPSVSVVAPVFNEGPIIQEFFARLRTALDRWCLEDTVGRRSWQVVFVNDGSTDDTHHHLRTLAKRDGRVVAVNLRRNFGQTAALAAGLDHSSGEVIITMDGDLQHLPEEIPLFMEKIAEGHDLVLGYRKDRRNDGLVRRIPSRCANLLMRKLGRVNVHDFGSTFKAFRREVIGEFEMFGDVHRFLPVLGAMAGCDMAQVPITNAPRRAGRSKYGLGRAFGVFVDILTLAFHSSFATRPGRPWGYLGLLLGGFGVAIQLTLLTLYMATLIHTPLERPGWLMLSVLLECSGLQCLGFAVMSDVLGRTHYASRQKQIYSVRSVFGRQTSPSEPTTQVVEEWHNAGSGFTSSRTGKQGLSMPLRDRSVSCIDPRDAEGP